MIKETYDLGRKKAIEKLAGGLVTPESIAHYKAMKQKTRDAIKFWQDVRAQHVARQFGMHKKKMPKFRTRYFRGGYEVSRIQ